ncbi:hypothetical protein FB45DRAFT_934755 [Roridomyces roridus]|uniref:Extracellular serine-rich protein n=1 Tax=Roridomyces roridus TaxID=1738132 RepID=A0AAD7BAT0_9AGAR|nr:hypothetical protein FB45DRAFT_934755 [Roridomyces roridus]
MFVTSLVAAVSAALVVSAQTVHQVTVGGKPGAVALSFDPSQITAAQNDVVQFVFSGVPGNHSVTQSSFANPCQAIPGGFDSGWVFNDDPTAPAPTWNLTVTATTPLWFYCKQLKSTPGPAHCNLEMVGVINIGTKSFADFASAASAASTVLQTEGALSGSGAFATAAPNITGPSQALFGAAPSATAPSDGSSGSSNSAGSSGTTSSPPANKTGGALVNGVNSLSALGAALFGVVLVL